MCECHCEIIVSGHYDCVCICVAMSSNCNRLKQLSLAYLATIHRLETCLDRHLIDVVFTKGPH